MHLSIPARHWALFLVGLQAAVHAAAGQQAFIQQPAIDPVAYLQSQVNAPDYTVADVWANHKHLPNWEDVRAAAADTWGELPKAFDPEYKNPCWTDEVTKVLKCLPYFQILGVSKCGTTDLYGRLTYHPDFVPVGWKGPHFWDESAFPNNRPRTPGKWDGSFGAYIEVFDTAAQRIAEDKAARVTGEASSNTFTGVTAYLRGASLPKRTNATLAQYLYEASPWSRFVVLMRDPVTRYYSAFYYYRSRALKPGTPEEFHERAASEIRQWRECVQQHGEVLCARMYRPQQLVKGMYVLFFQPWLDVFPRSRFLFMRTEDYKADGAAHVQAAADFLGLRRLDDGSWLQGAQQAERRNEKHYAPMLPETQTMLRDFYREYNQRLAEFMGGDTRWNWGY